MAKKFHTPIRMCISCRKRENQNNLIRLQCNEGSISSYNDYGRSFYLCNECIKEEKKVIRALMRKCKSKDKEKLMNNLKEIITNDRKS